MTATEFEVWTEQHYRELLSVASRLVNDPEDVGEVVHAAVVGVLANGHIKRIRHPWSFLVNAVRGKAKDLRISRARKNPSGLPSIKGRRGDQPGASPDEIRRRLRRLAPEQNAERWVLRAYLKRLEEARMVTDMDGYGRPQEP